jgi:Tfp pilus assembly protein PilW
MMRGAHSRGYSLVELMVALLAGLVVAMGVVGLSRVATNTFHEEMRISTSEMAIRLASDRLRADLGRASFMSSPNVAFDPLKTTPTANGGTVVAASDYDAHKKGIVRLAGVDYEADGSYAAAPAALRDLFDLNGLRPDSIVLGGNFTTADEYIVQSTTQNAGACNGGTITLSKDSAATLRITNAVDGSLKSDAEATAALLSAFQPVGGRKFLARIVDDTGHSQYLVLCKEGHASVAGVVTISIEAVTQIARSGETGTRGGVTGFGVGRFTVNPIQMVRWAISADITEPATKSNLTRVWLDALGNNAGKPEVVAEFAVDLEFAFAVMDKAQVLPGLQQRTFAFGNAGNAAWASLPGTTDVGPHAVRSVSFRLAVRGSTPDRDQNIPSTSPGYLYRYSLSADGNQFARVRTITSEVHLPNQLRQF